ncbi:uncharacterized protein EHS24_002214 [Apiotrichum porosum]|uniref:Uncharacterized protein n=1 Tax=Apiotrichum porosum TaxID=105984 RepID=A0A427XHW0_9TREE|nr:uncharacterized protein EHS24_002214 [Apiotrichum porosum]RSH78489.1 hypothetical protein EHS24_002214 [Apiotrichum porosum]
MPTTSTTSAQSGNRVKIPPATSPRSATQVKTVFKGCGTDQFTIVLVGECSKLQTQAGALGATIGDVAQKPGLIVLDQVPGLHTVDGSPLPDPRLAANQINPVPIDDYLIDLPPHHSEVKNRSKKGKHSKKPETVKYT